MGDSHWYQICTPAQDFVLADMKEEMIKEPE